MPDFWSDVDIYEQGGVAGPRGTGAVIDYAPAGAPAAPTPAPTPSGPANVGHNGAWNGMNREQWRDAWQGLGEMTTQAADAWLSSHGAARANAKGDRWTTPFGETMDLQQGRGGANDHGGTIRPIWGSGPSAPAPAPRGGPGDGAAMPTSPFGFGGGAAAPRASTPAYAAPTFDPFKYESFTAPAAFKAPTADEARQEPGYAFGLNQGLDVLSNKATAQGIRGGDVLKSFNDYANDYASTKYTDTYNRARDTYGLNFGNALTVNQANNQGRQGAFQANTTADLGYGNLANAVQGTSNAYSLGQGQLALGNKTADQSYALGQGNLALGNRQADQGYALGQGNLALGWGNYGLNAQGQQFFQDYQFPISTGFNAAQSTGGYGSIYAQNAGNNAAAGANARGAGAVAGANGWNAALGTLGNTALGVGSYYQDYR